VNLNRIERAWQLGVIRRAKNNKVPLFLSGANLQLFKQGWADCESAIAIESEPLVLAQVRERFPFEMSRD